MTFLFVPISSNAKTGPIATTISPSKTCPISCPLKGGGCYAKGGPSRIHWDRVDNGAGLAWPDFLAKIRQLWRGSLWRHNVAGDLVSNGRKVDAVKLAELTAANKGRAGFAYTHHDVTKGIFAKHNRNAIAAANKGGFTVNLSADNLAEADQFKALGIAPVVTVLPVDAPNTQLTPAGNRVIVCPAQNVDGITCARCGFCQKADRNVIIGFKAHGFQIAKANAVSQS